MHYEYRSVCLGLQDKDFLQFTAHMDTIPQDENVTPIYTKCVGVPKKFEVHRFTWDTTSFEDTTSFGKDVQPPDL